MKKRELDLTGAYYLSLAAVGVNRHVVRVATSDAAVAVFNDFRDHNGFGASDLKADCGDITDHRGKLVATVCYNGRVKLPDGRFLDGMSGRQWLNHCSLAKSFNSEGSN